MVSTAKQQELPYLFSIHHSADDKIRTEFKTTSNFKKELPIPKIRNKPTLNTKNNIISNNNQSKWAENLKTNILEYILLFIIDYNPKNAKNCQRNQRNICHKQLTVYWKSMYYTCKDWNKKLHHFISNEKFYFSRLYFKLYFFHSAIFSNINRISSNSIFVQKRLKKKRRLTIVFIDWDDTIFPTAYLYYLQSLHTKKAHNECPSNSSLVFQSNEKLQELIAIQIETLLQLIYTYGIENIFIVTNAKPYWMIKCMTIFFNNDYQMLYELIFFVYKIQCISARNMAEMFINVKSGKEQEIGGNCSSSSLSSSTVSDFDGNGAVVHDSNGYRAKTLVFAYILMKHLYKKVNINGDGFYSDVNIINIGDQENIEIQAIKTAMAKIDIFYKHRSSDGFELEKHLININLLPRPSLETMIIEWKFIQSKIRDFGTCDEKIWNIKYEQNIIVQEMRSDVNVHQPIILSRHESYE